MQCVYRRTTGSSLTLFYWYGSRSLETACDAAHVQSVGREHFRRWDCSIPLLLPSSSVPFTFDSINFVPGEPLYFLFLWIFVANLMVAFQLATGFPEVVRVRPCCMVISWLNIQSAVWQWPPSRKANIDSGGPYNYRRVSECFGHVLACCPLLVHVQENVSIIF